MSPENSQAILGAVFTSVALIWVLVWGVIATDDNARCICGCRKKRHVSPLDYDSDFGNPGRIGGVAAAYMEPGKCRDCRCRSFTKEYSR